MTDRADDLRQRLASIDWSSYETAYGSAVGVPAQILLLCSPEPGMQRQASHELWAGLCHQHDYVSSAALPALPFLVEALEHSSDELAVEIFDILVGFAVCTSPERDDRPSWAGELRLGLDDAKPIAERFSRQGSEEASDFAKWFLSALDSGS